MIPYGRQSIDEDDIQAVAEVLRGDWLTQGPAVERFERELAEKVEARHAVSFANGTAALHGATYAAGLGQGDLLVTSSLSFAASANCGRYVGTDVEFIDIDPKTLNLDPSSVPEQADALVAVHYAGLPVELDRLNRRPRVIIEDAAHAIGASTPDGPVGNCARSDMVMFSFHPVKTMTTAEGGAITTNDDDLAERLRRFRHHGIVRQPDEGAWAYDIPELGMNYRLTDVHAALGSSQLRKLERFIDRRHELACRYDAMLAELPVERAPAAPLGSVHGHHLYPVRVAHRRAVFDHLRENGILVQVHYVPIHRQSAYADPERQLPRTDEAYEQLLSLPLFPTLTDEDQDRVVEVLSEAIDATR